MEWLHLTDKEQLETIDESSSLKPVIVFKHSTTCSISKMAMMRFEDNNDLDLPCYYLDLLSYRPVSAAVAEHYSVHHESPQILVISKGECIYDASHFDIAVDEVKETLSYHQLA